eukprot:4138701-Lingulodinium_polyedra.AAC.1
MGTSAWPAWSSAPSVRCATRLGPLRVTSGVSTASSGATLRLTCLRASASWRAWALVTRCEGVA